MTARWEHTFVVHRASWADAEGSVNALLAAYGAAGWELVNYTNVGNSVAALAMFTFAFKRPLAPGPVQPPGQA